MVQGALGAADIRRVGYGLEVGCSGRGGAYSRHVYSLLLLFLLVHSSRRMCYAQRLSVCLFICLSVWLGL